MQNHDRETIILQWKRFIAGNEVDQSSIRPEILESWHYSKNKGIDINSRVAYHHNTDFLLERSQELITAAQPFMKMINEVIAGSGLRIDCIDFEGYFLCACGDPALLQESEYNGFVPGCNVSMDVLGTNAAGLCLALQQTTQVIGPEHFNVHLHNLNCSATPIFTPDAELVGVLNILSYATPQNRQTLGLTTSIAKAIENQLALNRTVTSLKVSNSELETIIEYLPQGVIALNSSGKVVSFNRKALELFAISPKANAGRRCRELEKILHSKQLNTRSKIHTEKEHTLSINGKKKSFIINVHSIENGARTLVMIEDSGRIMSLSATQSNRTSYTFGDIVGSCSEIVKARELASMVSATDSSVLLIGESGTGKELFAQAIHAASDRSKSPFVAINCGAIPADIIESELFGYEPGAFTGAREAGKPGRLEAASGGTLFLDEVEAMPLSFQVKLLRAFSSKSMVRVGGIGEIALNLRLIAASKVDLLEEVNQSRFREDLYYRIATFPIQIPSLRERAKDIRLLTMHFLEQISNEYSRQSIKADDNFYEALVSYSWRGNVRELRNVLERAVVLGLDMDILTPDQLPDTIRKAWMTNGIKQRTRASRSGGESENESLLQLAEHAAIAMVLEEEGGNISRSARRLGIARSTLYQKLDAAPHLLNVR
ncbi:sigma-54-dependent Fis family transcriptional regulator [Maridesulfovibrio sp.]|uniref:sigma-54-dependent Fis family transcriptional regulator n=1 Tax=unclassified Maridesulfovibrio TaxID=2794999 RepID=UPI003AFFBB80